MKAWWSQVLADYRLEPHHLLLLTHACEAWDAAERARLLVAEEGQVLRDRFGQPRTHPAVKVEVDNRAAFARLVRQLDLEGEVDAMYRRT